MDVYITEFESTTVLDTLSSNHRICLVLLLSGSIRNGNCCLLSSRSLCTRRDISIRGFIASEQVTKGFQHIMDLLPHTDATGPQEPNPGNRETWGLIERD